MTDKQYQTLQSPPASSYDRAIARAVEWLGDRYLLAKPINAHTLPVGNPRRLSIGAVSTARERLELMVHDTACVQGAC